MRLSTGSKQVILLNTAADEWTLLPCSRKNGRLRVFFPDALKTKKKTVAGKNDKVSKT